VSTALNQTLFNLLTRVFGEVNIVNQGEKMIAYYVTRQRKGKSYEELSISHSGEEYVVSCPFCNDTRRRLTINHMWGVWDERTKSFNKRLMHCYNEECQQERANCEELYQEVYQVPAGQHAAARRQVRIRPGRTVEVGTLCEKPWPGDVIRLDKLAKQEPTHKAVSYLEERGFDPVKLARHYGFSYCTESDYHLAEDRIIIPIFWDDKMVGWQARYIGTPPESFIPRYWTCPGMPRRLVGYGFQQAMRYRTPIIVEGPLDRVNIGPQAMACLGKTLSQELCRRIDRLLGEKSSLVILLDPKADKPKGKRAPIHHIERLYRLLSPQLQKRTVRVYLPDESMDPGSTERGQLFDIIQEQADEQKVPVWLGETVVTAK
jgi:hypothetical protein